MGTEIARDVGRGTKVFEAPTVRGEWRMLHAPDDVLALMDTSADGVVACVADAGATFLAPIFDELTAVVCLSGTPLSHIGIVSREYRIPCVMGAVLDDEPADGDVVEVDCSGDDGIVRRAVNPDRDAINAWLHYHGEISFALSAQRQSLESALIPVTAYILVSALECYRRHPAMMREIAAAMAPEDIGATGRIPGNQIDGVHLWSIANIGQYGRKMLEPLGMLDPADDLGRNAVVMDFWTRAAGAFRADGHLQAWDADGRVTPYASYVDEIVAATRRLDAAERTRMTRLNATLTSYLFLLYFDTRAGYQDTGPYRLPDGRTLLLRAFSKFGVSDFPWSSEIGAQLPFADVLAAFVLDGVEVRVTDFGTSVTNPEDYLPRVESFALFSTTAGRLEPIDTSGVDALLAAVKRAQRDLYRLVAGMTRREKIDAGAYVYFSFLRPFAEVAGIADRLDWTVPRDSLDLYPMLELVEESGELVGDGATWYPPVA